MLTGNARRERLRVGRRAALAALAVAVVACGDGGAEPTVASTLEAETAVTVCGHLRTFTNDLAAAANRAVTGINDLSPTGRTEQIVAGFDEGIAIATAAEAGLDGLPVPDRLPERDRLLDELSSGMAAAVQELRDERDRFTDEVPEVTDADVRGRVGQFFNAVEKAMSVAEPAIGGYGRRAFEAAFLDEPTCRHVVQQYRLDD